VRIKSEDIFIMRCPVLLAPHFLGSACGELKLLRE